MNFDERLTKAIDRGHRVKVAQAEADAEQSLNLDQLKALHAKYRLELSEYIEVCLGKLADHFPGFRYATVVDEQGWGAAVSRDDLGVAGGARENYFSRLKMLIRPHSTYNVIDLVAKGTVRNKEIFNRNQFQRLAEADIASFTGLIDLWVLEFAESYAASE